MSKLAALKKFAISAQPRDRLGHWTAEGNAREAKARIVSASRSLLTRNASGIKAGIVNLGEAAGSQLGHAIAGDAGQLAGGLVGTLATRKAIADIESTYSAHQKVKSDEGYTALSRMQKLQKLREKAIAEAEAKKEQTQDEMLEDGAGWAIGNASGRAIAAALPAISSIPGLGAPPAMLLSPKVVTLKQRLISYAKKRRRSYA